MYGSLTNWRAYATARGNSAPADAEDPAATAALVRASDMVRIRYVANLLPAYDPATLQPTGFDYTLVETAVYEAAFLELATPGFFSKTFTAAEQKVLTAVDKIRWTVVGDPKGSYSAMPVHTLVDAIFKPYVSDRDAPGFMFRSVGPSLYG